MKRFILISVLSLLALPLYAQTPITSPFVESGTLVINNNGFKPVSIRTIPVTRPTPMHIHSDAVNATFPAKFAVAKSDLAQIGTWAWACGWNTPANSAVSGVPASVIPTGCAAYFEPGLDAGIGKWRVPTQREMCLIVIARFELATVPGYTQIGANSTYWTSTQSNATRSLAITMSGSSMFIRDKTIAFSVRCIRDL